MSTPSEPALLRVHDLHKSYGDLEVLKGINLELKAGETLSLIGPSGSGKSTCLRCINYLEKPTRGDIWLGDELIGQIKDGKRIRLMSDREMAPQRREIAMVFQLFYLWPHLSVRDNVALGPIKAQGMPRKQAYELADAMLEKVHLRHKAEVYPEQLSGGQQQRVAIARALAQQPKVILFDEPTSALDPELVGEVLAVIRELAQEGRTMIMVTHEVRFARDVADRVIFMDGGHIVEQGPSAQVIDNPSHERTRSFLGRMAMEGA
ncbi:polar amino acid transport system ATP-binding protein [Pseudomonas sp. PvR086]|jgi:polar amino acid transport system ATP-binding protein|uniref:amino acid ABC transporter ATP-binding protein n=1 Tax=Pseudomonas TaxID=286 RepID=UPI000B35D4E0|nr:MULTISPECIES: amino acid ABC transporter ATP-binding protein [Pseudomonas]MBD9607938.1 amino acid ABC transporter ATP-binding protein [Pseudomonas sp. PDM08]MDR7108904.1 polar amino acid transport system ATP-binding protein [Pseudomonas frederiksbergensis]PMY52339.1 amino acid ABC transporter ATP-binding protein [Pseudomonas sp. FW305-53]PMY87807.1 amino acid ABC transporter ATP-binding protein [Pseudomonas sp. FW303-C2]PMY94057.1 amino acid ABC transporter ATP-binding protein [Pseudomonas 